VDFVAAVQKAFTSLKAGERIMPKERISSENDGWWRLNRLAVALLLGGWTVAAALLLLIGDPLGARFLDLPLGALLAGQGALVGLVIVGVRVAYTDTDESA
jgi:uncharacterized membrane protein